MRVLMVNTFHHRRGGDATYTFALTELLKRAGHSVVPLAMRHPDNDPSTWEAWFAPGVDFRDLTRRRDRLRAALSFVHNRDAARRCAALIRRVRPDIVHLQHVHHHLTPSVLGAAEEAGVPVVWTVHDYELICPSAHLFAQGAPCEQCRGHRYHRAVARRCKRGGLVPSALAAVENAVHAVQRIWHRVDRFLCPSRFLADKLVEFGVPASRVRPCPNFLAVPEAVPPLGHGWLYAGRLTEEKGLWTLLEAARHLPEYPLTLCGSGPLESELRRAAADLPQVRFRGHLSPAALQRALAASAVVAVPSIWYENFPYAVLEAQALGRAVVASQIGGITEQISSAQDGVLVPPNDARALADAVGALLADRARAEAMGHAGRARVARDLAPQDHLARIVAHYQDVIAERP